MESPTLLPSDQQKALSEPALGDFIPEKKTPNIDMFLREARVSDVPQMATHNMHAYHDTHLYRFICPRATQYPEDMTRAFRQKLRRRLLVPNNITIVAVLFFVLGFAVSILGWTCPDQLPKIIDNFCHHILQTLQILSNSNINKLNKAAPIESTGKEEAGCQALLTKWAP